MSSPVAIAVIVLMPQPIEHVRARVLERMYLRSASGLSFDAAA